MRKYYDDLLAHAREVRYVETYFGRRRYIPSISDANRTIRQIAEREAMNMPIQGTAADILKYAMLDIDAYIRDNALQGKMILQVHDELVFDIPASEEGIFTKMVPEIMENILAKYLKKDDKKKLVPIIAEVGAGENWATAK